MPKRNMWQETQRHTGGKRVGERQRARRHTWEEAGLKLIWSKTRPSPPKTQRNRDFIERIWPAMRAHPSWQRSIHDYDHLIDPTIYYTWRRHKPHISSSLSKDQIDMVTEDTTTIRQGQAYCTQDQNADNLHNNPRPQAPSALKETPS